MKILENKFAVIGLIIFLAVILYVFWPMFEHLMAKPTGKYVGPEREGLACVYKLKGGGFELGDCPVLPGQAHTKDGLPAAGGTR